MTIVRTMTHAARELHYSVFWRFRVGLICAIFVACADSTAPGHDRARVVWIDGRPNLVGPGVIQFPLPPQFVEDEQLILQGIRKDDGTCIYRSTFAVRVGSERSGKLRKVDEVPREFDPETCLFVASRQFSLVDSLSALLARRNALIPLGIRGDGDGGLVFQEASGGKEFVAGRINSSPDIPPLFNESCPPWGDPGYARQQTIVRDPLFITVNFDLNENHFVYNWYCIRDPYLVHTMGWRTSTGWNLIAWGTPPVYLASGGAWMETNPWSQYWNESFPACTAPANANHQTNQIRVFADGFAIMTAYVSIGGPTCATWLSWIVSRTYPY